MNDTVTIVRAAAGTEDRYGNVEPDWENATLTEAAAKFAPTGQTEVRTDGREGVVIGATIYLPTGTDILSTDRVMVREATWIVDGQPNDWRHSFGTGGGIEVQIRRVEG